MVAGVLFEARRQSRLTPEVFGRMVLRTRGLLPRDALAQSCEHVDDVNALLDAIRVPVARDRELRLRWVREVAARLVRMLGDPGEVRGYLAAA